METPPADVTPSGTSEVVSATRTPDSPSAIPLYPYKPDRHELLASTAVVAGRLQQQARAGYVGEEFPYDTKEIAYMCAQLTAAWTSWIEGDSDHTGTPLHELANLWDATWDHLRREGFTKPGDA
jgi:hypothetical protein